MSQWNECTALIKYSGHKKKSIGSSQWIVQDWWRFQVEVHDFKN